MHKVESNRDLRGVKGIGESLCDLLGIKREEREYLRLCGGCQGEGTCTLLEIITVKYPRSLGKLEEWGRASVLCWGNTEVKYPRLFGEAEEWGKASKLC